MPRGVLQKNSEKILENILNIYIWNIFWNTCVWMFSNPLTLQAPISQNGQTQSNNSSALEIVTSMAIKERIICLITIETVICMMHCRKYHLHNYNRNFHLHNYNNNCHHVFAAETVTCVFVAKTSNCVIATETVTA